MEKDDKDLQFVLHYYEPARFDTQAAIKKLVPRRQNRPRRWAAAAAVWVVLGISALAIGLLTTHQEASVSPSESTESTPAIITPDVRPESFNFENAPLPQVLYELSAFYGVTLRANDTTKHLTGHLDTLSLEHNVAIIEQVLGVEISIEP